MTFCKNNIFTCMGFRRKWTALALYKSISPAILWFQIHHRITFATTQNPAVYLSGARVNILPTLVSQLCMFVTDKWSILNSLLSPATLSQFNPVAIDIIPIVNLVTQAKHASLLVST